MAGTCDCFSKSYIATGEPPAWPKGGYGECLPLKPRAAITSTIQLNPWPKWWCGITGERRAQRPALHTGTNKHQRAKTKALFLSLHTPTSICIWNMVANAAGEHTHTHLTFVLVATKAIFRNAIHQGLAGEQRRRKTEAIRNLITFLSEPGRSPIAYREDKEVEALKVMEE